MIPDLWVGFFGKTTNCFHLFRINWDIFPLLFSRFFWPFWILCLLFQKDLRLALFVSEWQIPESGTQGTLSPGGFIKSSLHHTF